MKTQTPSPASIPRASLALLVVASLFVLLVSPLCATAACPMGEHAERMGCEPLDGGCCQTQGAPAVDTPQALPPALASSPVGAEAGEGVRPALPALLADSPALPAFRQGIGLHAFLEVFLI